MIKNLLLYAVMLLMIMTTAIGSILGVYTLGITLKYLFETWRSAIVYQSTINDIAALFIISITFVWLLCYWAVKGARRLFDI